MLGNPTDVANTRSAAYVGSRSVVASRQAQFKDLAQTWMRSASGDLAGKLYSVTHEGGLF